MDSGYRLLHPCDEAARCLVPCEGCNSVCWRDEPRSSARSLAELAVEAAIAHGWTYQQCAADPDGVVEFAARLWAQL